eukprot:3415224-Alexandrium_andersonii.AAC.1
MLCLKLYKHCWNRAPYARLDHPMHGAAPQPPQRDGTELWHAMQQFDMISAEVLHLLRAPPCMLSLSNFEPGWKIVGRLLREKQLPTCSPSWRRCLGGTVCCDDSRGASKGHSWLSLALLDLRASSRVSPAACEG